MSEPNFLHRLLLGRSYIVALETHVDLRFKENMLMEQTSIHAFIDAIYYKVVMN